MMKRWCLLVVTALVLLAARPGDAGVYRAREMLAEGQAKLAEGHNAAALERFEEALDEDVDLLAAYRVAIPLWVQAGNFVAMRRRLERVTSRHPDFATAWYALAYAYRRLGRHDFAVLAYQNYIGLRPREASPLFGLAMAYKNSGNYAAAEMRFLRYLRRESDPMHVDYVQRARVELFALALRRIARRYIELGVARSTSTHCDR